jgi:hypothetical protein
LCGTRPPTRSSTPSPHTVSESPTQDTSAPLPLPGPQHARAKHPRAHRRRTRHDPIRHWPHVADDAAGEFVEREHRVLLSLDSGICDAVSIYKEHWKEESRPIESSPRGAIQGDAADHQNAWRSGVERRTLHPAQKWCAVIPAVVEGHGGPEEEPRGAWDRDRIPRSSWSDEPWWTAAG